MNPNIWYYVTTAITTKHFTSTASITRFEVVKETDELVWVKGFYPVLRPDEISILPKKSIYGHWFPTLEEAKKFGVTQFDLEQDQCETRKKLWIRQAEEYKSQY